MLVAFTALMGCSSNARFELFLELPQADASATFIVFEARSFDPTSSEARPDYFELWSEDSTSSGGALNPDAAANATVAVEAEGSQIDHDLSIKLRFCQSAGCVSDDGALRREAWLQFERPFHPGKITFYNRLIINMIPAECDLTAGTCDPGVTAVDQCQIGCDNVTDISTGFCGIEEGVNQHYCRPLVPIDT